MADEFLRGIQPRTGRLEPLRTHAEVHASVKLEDGLIVLVAPRDVQTVLRRINVLLDGPPQLAHLRRIAKLCDLPAHVKETLSSGIPDSVLDRCSTPAQGSSRTPLALLAGPLSSFPDGLSSTLSEIPFITRTIPIPSDAPPDRASADLWTAQHWPTAWKNHNPYGPQPVQWEREGARIERRAGTFLGVARALGHELQSMGSGAGMGAVVVDSETGAIVTGAGDARWHAMSAASPQGSGNALAHAPMRALALLGRQRQRLDQRPSPGDMSPVFQDTPLTPTERTLDAASTLQKGGYLATALDVYLTHEPCVMCTMALVHSRVGAVVFARRMRGTGGLVVSDPNSGYGLWWRSELNWRMMAWEFVDDEKEKEGRGGVGDRGGDGEGLDEAVHA